MELLTRLFSTFLSGPVHSRAAPRSRAIAELKALHQDVQGLYEASPISGDGRDEFLASLVGEVCKEVGRPLAPPLVEAIAGVIIDCMADDGLWCLPTVDWSVEFTIDEEVTLRRHLTTERQFFSRYDEYADIWRHKLTSVLAGVLGYLPPSPLVEQGAEDTQTIGGAVPLATLLDDPAECIERIMATFAGDDVVSRGLFLRTALALNANLCRQSGFEPNRPPPSSRMTIWPTKTKGLSPEALADRYLDGTPLATFFATPVPMRIPRAVRFEHAHVVAGTGHGKTQLLQSLILEDLGLAIEGKCGICVIDSQGDLIRNISKLGVFDPGIPGSLASRLVIVDPTDIEYPPCLNLFDIHQEDLGRLPAASREMFVNGAVELYEYLFGSLLGAELTQRQGVIFTYLARLLMAIPDATIHTLRALMEDGEPFRPYMERLPGSAKAFFATQFFSSQFSATKRQILARLWSVLANTTLERMFSHTENKIDIRAAMAEGKIVLVNTAKDLLKADGSQLLGRFFLAMITQAALERATQDPSDRLPFYVYVDEAEDYVDERVETMLNQLRKYKVAMTLSHQTLDQLTPRLRATFMASTSIKFAGGVNSKDAAEFAREMHAESNFIHGMRKRHAHTEFACYIRNVTPHPIRLSVPFGLLESIPTLSDEARDQLIAENRTRHCAPWTEEVGMPSPPPAPTPAPTTAPQEATPTDSVAPEPEPPPSEAATKRRAPAALPPFPTPGRGGAEHKYIQQLLKRAGEEYGFHTRIEAEVPDGNGAVDVSLESDVHRIACEISITTTAAHELENIKKCLAAGYDQVLLVAPKIKRLSTLRTHIEDHLTEDERPHVQYFTSEECLGYLEGLAAKGKSGAQERVRGYKVKVNYQAVGANERQRRRSEVAEVLLRSMKQLGNAKQ